MAAAATPTARTARNEVSSRALVPGAVLHRRREPDALVVLLQHLLARDFVARAHPCVLRLGRARMVAAVQVRRRHQATDVGAAAWTGVERRILHTVPGLVDDPAALTLVFVGRHHVLPNGRGRPACRAGRPCGLTRRRRAAAPSAGHWPWS